MFGLGLLSSIKLIGVVVIVAVLGFFVWNYQHMQKQLAIDKIQITSLKEANAYYEKQAKIDAKTREVHDDIQKAVDAGDVERVRALYEQLRQHRRGSKSNTTPKAKHGSSD